MWTVWPEPSRSTSRQKKRRFLAGQVDLGPHAAGHEDDQRLRGHRSMSGRSEAGMAAAARLVLPRRQLLSGRSYGHDGGVSALAETIATEGAVLEHVLELDPAPTVGRLEGAERVWLVGTGTSEHAAWLGAAMLATAGLDARPCAAAGFVAAPPRLGPEDAVVVITHTAETISARAARELASAAGARTVAITGEGKGWPEAIEAAPPERSETYTASYLAALLVLARLAVALGGKEWDEAQLAALPALVEAAGAEPLLVERPPRRLIVLCGAGPAAITAREGALKLREAARLLAEGFESEYLLHGSAVPLDADDLLIAVDPGGDATGLTAGLLRAAAQEGLTVATLDPPADLHPLLAQLPMTVRLQQLASRWADARHLDPDRVILGAWADTAFWE
jgi:glucosamine--fructose-6-phosphate aminotransferase (isomerizing)